MDTKHVIYVKQDYLFCQFPKFSNSSFMKCSNSSRTIFHPNLYFQNPTKLIMKTNSFQKNIICKFATNNNLTPLSLPTHFPFPNSINNFNSFPTQKSQNSNFLLKKSHKGILKPRHYNLIQAVRKTDSNSNIERRTNVQRNYLKKNEKKIDPVGIVHDDPSLKPFAQHLRERYKLLKDLKEKIEEEDVNIFRLSEIFMFMGIHRNPFPAVDYVEWAPGARYCALIGEFNNWMHRVHFVKDGKTEKDDDGYFYLFVKDTLKQEKEEEHQEGKKKETKEKKEKTGMEGEEGEEEEEEKEALQMYNYDVDFDSGDRPLDWDGIYEMSQGMYWEEGENHFLYPYVDLEHDYADLDSDDVEGLDRLWEKDGRAKNLDWIEKSKKVNAHMGWVNGANHYKEYEKSEGGFESKSKSTGGAGGDAEKTKVKSQDDDDNDRMNRTSRTNALDSDKVSEKDETVPNDFDSPNIHAEGAAENDKKGDYVFKMDNDWPFERVEEYIAMYYGKLPKPNDNKTNNDKNNGEKEGEGDERKNIPNIMIEDDVDNQFVLIKDEKWRDVALNKKLPYAYWLGERKGRREWEKKYDSIFNHLEKYRTFFFTNSGPVERISPWCTYVLPDTDGRKNAIFWDPPLNERYKWKNNLDDNNNNDGVDGVDGVDDVDDVDEYHTHSSNQKENKYKKNLKNLKIYEAHIGISSPHPHVSSFDYFTENVLPHIKESGYNAVQLFGIMEHADYGSRGYNITNYFAVSSRFGNPEQFKKLVDTAHGLGLLIILVLNHSYASNKEYDGLSNFDGSDDSYFYKGKRGHCNNHESRIFKFNNYHVLRFLMSNLRWWIQEYNIDGYYFPSLPSMIYTHHGNSNFENGLEEYFNQYIDDHALNYLILANELVHGLKPDFITIANDYTVYPGLCSSTNIGGLGFDYRTNDDVAKMWHHLINHVSDSDWKLTDIVNTLTNQRKSEKTLVYTENNFLFGFDGISLSEILIGKELKKIEKLLNNESNNNNSTFFEIMKTNSTLLRGISLLKMIRLLTFSLGGNAFLSFSGSEFSHAGHLNFPSQRNQFDFSNACRNWDLLKNKNLPFKGLHEFDKAMLSIDEKCEILNFLSPRILHLNEKNKVLAFSKGKLLFIFNFNPKEGFERYKIFVEDVANYELILNSDAFEFGGLGRVAPNSKNFKSEIVRGDKNFGSLILNLPAQTSLVLMLTKLRETKDERS